MKGDLLELVEEAARRLQVEDLFGDLAKLRLAGKTWSACCPFHPDKEPSFTIYPDRLGWKCWSRCGSGTATQYIQRRRSMSWKDAALELCRMARIDVQGEAIATAPRRRPARPLAPPPRPQPTPVPSTIAGSLQAAQARLPGSPGEEYLSRRAIPLDLAQRYGLGYSPGPEWPAGPKGWAWKHGRVVIPHTDPSGQLVNVYGRAIAAPTDDPKSMRHRHHELPTGWFNAAAVQSGDGPLFIAEGPFDALSLIAAGHPRAVAIFGVANWRPEWIRRGDRVVLAFDADAAGDQWRRLADELLERGHEVARLGADEYGGFKDANEALVAGVLRVGRWPIPDGFVRLSY